MSMRRSSVEVARRISYGQAVDRRTRATSLDRERRKDRYESGGRKGGTLPADIRKKAKVNHDVHPLTDFASLRRGFTLNGHPILPSDEAGNVIKDDDDCAGVWWGIYVFVLALSIGNLITSLLLVRILGLGLTGLEHLEVMPKENMVRLWGILDMELLIHKNGNIFGYKDENLTISGPGAQVSAQGFGSHGPELRVTADKIVFENIYDFSLRNPGTGEIVFSTSDPQWDIVKGLDELEVHHVEVGDGGIVSSVDEPLKAEADNELQIRGAEGILMEGRKISLTAEDDISLQSTGGAVKISGEVQLDTVMLPMGGSVFAEETNQYKLCVCMQSGKLFKVAVPRDKSNLYGCHVFDPKNNPCD